MSGPVALFGAAGQLGREILEFAARRGEAVKGFTRADADICDVDAVRAALEGARPRLVVNAAGWTAVDLAESNPEGARAANATGPGVLARAAAEAGVPLVHVSTDYVFDGAKPGAWIESDPVAPLGVYGATKAEGERLVREAGPRHVILRTSWVYGVHGANFLKTMLRLAGERDELRVVADQHGCPTATADLAEAIFAVDRAIAAGGCPWGTFHFAGTGATTWHGFACEIVEAAAKFTHKRPMVTAIPTADFPTPARRPANSALDSGKFARTFGYVAAPWRQRVRETVRALLREA